MNRKHVEMPSLDPVLFPQNLLHTKHNWRPETVSINIDWKLANLHFLLQK